MDSFGLPLDLPDVGEAVSFFATRRFNNPAIWQYHYGLQFPSTYKYGSEGRCGDGDDIILAEGTIEMPQRVIDDNDEEGYLYEFAFDNAPAIPDKALEEFNNDQVLMECSEYLDQDSSYANFESLYFDVMGIEEPDDVDCKRANELLEWGNENGWQWDFWAMGIVVEEEYA